MKLNDAFNGVNRCFLDTAPIIYYVEQNFSYFAIACSVFQRLRIGDFTAVTSPVTLAECLVVPCRQGLTQLKQDFVEVITAGKNTVFTPITAEVGQQAAELRVLYNLKLPDALQIAVAVVAELKKLYDVKFTYNSNAIEGNTLTQSETALVLETGITIGGKTLREHLEVIGHKDAIDYIETLTQLE